MYLYCILFCACIVTPSSLHILAATFADPNFLECLKGACICIDIILCLYCDMTLVFYCSYLQAEPNLLEHLKGACVCIALLCRVSHMTFPLLILSLNKSD